MVPFLDTEDIARHAREFLRRHNGDGAVPVNIEHIVEFELAIDIVPVPGLMKSRGINGYLSADRKTIYVDDYMFENFPTRYLFTLAHEVGHLLLHGALYPTFRTDEEWLSFHKGLAAHGLDAAEVQANKFASLVLMPEDPARALALEEYRRMASEVLSKDGRFDLTGEAFWLYVAESLASRFSVSAQTAQLRLMALGLWRTKLPL